MRSLPVLGSELHGQLLRLSKTRELREEISLVEGICARILDQMRRQGYTTGKSDFLMDHLPEIMGGIRAPGIRGRGIHMVF